MPPTVHDFAWPDRVVIGTIGVPGARTFYLQVRTGKQIVSIALEKLQSAQLADKIDEVLDQLLTVDGNPFSVPTSTPPELIDDDQLEPVQEQFRAGIMSLGWDPTTAQIVLEAYPLTDLEEDAEGEVVLDEADVSEVLRVRMPVGTARAFAKRTREVVAAGRPICPLCGEPIDADGHICAISES
ncbi:DUF3090 family protein [Arthrobacter sp. JZ12]|uniref:DUF3090 domain-containing protein n=1 Tax=Arthrobacter sp. JZ12 TaxID=2654190 RepID=UPI002B46A658|nr:DUF3090 domain-containing protein [Arthrobacter sp. JZ12]WRH24815.1 DUF3090 family protein [Arthrobacter sp. JZ12]